MSSKVENLSDEQAIAALTSVAQKWIEKDKSEVFTIYFASTLKADTKPSELPVWVNDPNANVESAGTFARKMLSALEDPRDERISEWLESGVNETTDPQAHSVEMILAGGIILIGAILAARVRKIGAVEFYEGVPEELASVLKAVQVLFK